MSRMRFDKLTIKSQEAVQRAQEIAGERSHSSIGTLHVLSALLEQPEGSTLPVLQKLGVVRNVYAAEAPKG